MSLRETIETLRDDIVEQMDRGLVPGPETLSRLRAILDEAINRDTLENIGRCTRNDWCRAPLDHEGTCVPFENAEAIFEFFSKDGLVKVDITKKIGERAVCQVRHREVLLFDGVSKVETYPEIPRPTPPSRGLTSLESDDTPVD